jgi:hypothetical protein
MKYILIIFTFLTLLSCNDLPKNPVENRVDIIEKGENESPEVKIDTTLFLANGFKLDAGQKENFGDFNTFTFLKLTLNNIEVTTLKDSLEFEFGYGFRIYPSVTKLLDENEFEIAIEVNDRPNKNYLLLLTVEENSVVKTRQVPTFITAPINLDNDEKIEVAGFWNYAQIWGKDDQLTAYNPIIYYELTENGLFVDSSLTEEQNKNIYGSFEGYQFSETIEMPVEVMKKMGEEINRIGEKE